MLRKLKCFLRPWCWITKHKWQCTIKSHCYAKGYIPPVEHCKCYRCDKVDKLSVLDRIGKETILESWTVNSGEATMEKLNNE